MPSHGVVAHEVWQGQRGRGERLLALMALVCGLFVVFAPPAGAAEPLGTVTNFPNTISYPEAIAAGPDGNLWFTNLVGDSIGRITPAGVVSNFTGTGISGPSGIAASADGNLWFTNSGSDSIGRITPAGVVSNFAHASISTPRGIVAGPDGNVWFTNAGNDSIGRITPAGVVSNFTGTGISGPWAIAAGPDGNLWFTNSYADSIGRITPAGVVSNFVHASIHTPQGIAAGPDGNLWFTNLADSSIGRITPAGVVSNFTDPSISSPETITAGPDGNLWFPNPAGNTIGRITPAGVVADYTDPNITGSPRGITAGPDGNLWFTVGPTLANFTGSIGRITPAGVVSNFKGTAIRNPTGIAAGPDGNVWFTNTDSIGRITPAGVVSNFTDPSISGPQGITAGPDGNLWFTDFTGSIGRITPAGVVSNFTDPSISSPWGIAAGGDGNLWFTNLGDNSIGRITPAGVVSNFTDPSITGGPRGITGGPDGNVWFTVGDSIAGNGSIGRITPAGAVSIFTDPTIDGPEAVTRGPDGNLWFTNRADDSIGRITPAGVVSNFTDPSISTPEGITAGPDGNLWIANASGSIGRITPAGVVSDFADLTIIGAAGIATGADGNLWFTNTLRNSIGRMGTAPVPGAGFRAVTPVRALDSRGSTGGWASTPLGVDQSRDLVVAGVNGVPWSATAVVMNVTVTGGTKGSYLQAYPAGVSPRPVTANLLFGPGQTVPNLVTVGVGAGGAVSFYNQQGSVHVIADVVGYYDDGTDPTAPLFRAVTPVRALDSRGSTGGWASTPLGANQSADLVVAGEKGVPVSATAVVMNVTVTGGTKGSYLQAYPAGVSPRPVTANLLFGPGQTVPNLVTVGVGAGGAVSFYNQQGSVHVIADVVGYFDPAPGGSRYHSVAPTRTLDSRQSSGAPWNGTPLAGARSLTVAGTPNVPANATGIVANATATGGTNASYLSVSPKPGQIPAPTANLLFGSGQSIPNAVTVGLGTGGAIDLFNQLGTVHVIVDTTGYYAPV